PARRGVVRRAGRPRRRGAGSAGGVRGLRRREPLQPFGRARSRRPHRGARGAAGPRYVRAPDLRVRCLRRAPAHGVSQPQAARDGVVTPAQIADLLQDSLTVLSAGRRTALTRQQTLTATIDWSHALLDVREQTLFRRLGVFAGHCDLDALEAVCDGDLDLLGRLVDKSLIVVDEHGGSARYRLLDTVRHYARERLAAAGETIGLARRHRAYYLQLAET